MKQLERRSRFILALVGIVVVSDFAGDAQAATVLWTRDIGQQILSSPAVAGDGTVYVGSATALYAITNAGGFGSNKWIFPAGVPAFTCSPSLGTSGPIYFGDNGSNDTLHALNPDGSELWSIPIQTNFQFDVLLRSTPALAFDGTIHFAAGDRLFAVSPAGDIKWSYTIDNNGSTTVSPALGAGGALYATAAFGRTLYRLRPDGTAVWSAPLPADGAGAVAVNKEGNLYVAAGGLYAFAPDGSQLWGTNVEYALDGLRLSVPTGTFTSQPAGHIPCSPSIQPGSSYGKRSTRVRSWYPAQRPPSMQRG